MKEMVQCVQERPGGHQGKCGKVAQRHVAERKGA
jgi:hypothetical protein